LNVNQIADYEHSQCGGSFFNLKAPTAVYKGAGGCDCVTNGVVERDKIMLYSLSLSMVGGLSN
jgi:hypothetical protein